MTNHSGPVVLHLNGFDVIDCVECGFRHIIPLPSPEDLEKLYKEAFYQTDLPNYLKNSMEDRDWKTLEMADRFDSVEAHLGIQAGLALDIGSGPGEFLETGQKRGWQTIGVEPSSDAASFCRDKGLTVKEGLFDQTLADQLLQEFGGPVFDFIHMSEVLEHVLEPIPLLETAASLLRPGGMICISCPNDFNAFQQAVTKATNTQEWWVHPHHHINYFTFESLEKLVSRIGLTPTERSTNFPMEFFILAGEDYRNNPEKGRAMHAKRKAFDQTLARHEPASRKTFYRQLAAAGLGRLAIVFAEKP